MYFLGIDLGTSYFKVALFNESGQLKGLSKKAVPVSVSGSKVELSVTAFWQVLYACLQAALDEANAKVTDISGISYASQANTFILVNKYGKPLTPLILWTDQTAALDENFLNFTKREDWLQKTGIGIPFNAGFCINKCIMLQKSDSILWDQVDSVLSISDFLTFSLTRQKATDHSTSSLLGLMDIEKSEWWDAAIGQAGLNIDQLPTIIQNRKDGMRIVKANPLGLSPDTVFFLGGLDHHLAAIGVGVGNGIEMSESTGTVIAAILDTENPERIKNACTAKAFTPGRYFKMAFDLNGAIVLEWYHRNFAPELSLDKLSAMAGKVPDSAGLVALPRADLYGNKAGFLNSNSTHQHAHYVRSIMESTARSLQDLINKVDILNETKSVYSTGGGAKSSIWSAIKQEVTGKIFLNDAGNEAACRGAAMIAAVGKGQFGSLNHVQGIWLKNNLSLVNGKA